VDAILSGSPRLRRVLVWMGARHVLARLQAHKTRHETLLALNESRWVEEGRGVPARLQVQRVAAWLHGPNVAAKGILSNEELATEN